MASRSAFQWLYTHTVDHSRFREVGTRFIVFLAPFFIMSRLPNWDGLGLIFLGVLIRTWAAGFLKKDQRLALAGPYLLARHPLYLGSILLAFGMIWVLHHWFVTLTLGPLTVFVYWDRIRKEEVCLTQTFGQEYVSYQKLLGPLWPSMQSLRMLFSHGANKGHLSFSFQQYLKNKEYECLLGVLVALGATYGLSLLPAFQLFE